MMIDEAGLSSGGGLIEGSIQTDPVAHEEFATWLVGSRGPLGGVGGESEVFEQEVVAFADSLEPIARGTDTLLQEGNWFRQVSVAQTQAMARFALDTRLGLSALGNAAGSIGDAYDATDRKAARLFESEVEKLAVFYKKVDSGVPGEAPVVSVEYFDPTADPSPHDVV